MVVDLIITRALLLVQDQEHQTAGRAAHEAASGTPVLEKKNAANS